MNPFRVGNDELSLVVSLAQIRPVRDFLVSCLRTIVFPRRVRRARRGKNPPRYREPHMTLARQRTLGDRVACVSKRKSQTMRMQLPATNTNRGIANGMTSPA